MSTGPAGPALDRLDGVRLDAAAGAAPRSLDRLPERAVRAVVTATEAGAPIAEALAAARAALEDDAARRRALAVATAQARAVAGGLVAAPLVLLPVLAGVLDLDPLAFYARPTGVVTGAVAGVLLLGGALWIRGLLRRAGRVRERRPGALAAAAGLAGGIGLSPVLGIVAAAVVWVWARRRAPGPVAAPGVDEVADLVATAMRGGAGPAAALRTAADRRIDLADPLRRLALAVDLDRPPPRLPPGIDRVGALLLRARAAGAPVVPALRDLAADLRADQRARALAAAERLPVQLTFPTALCLLPGSLLLVGAPLVASGLETAGL